MKFKHGKNLKIIDKRSVFIGKDVIIGDNVTIYENNRIDGMSVIGDNVVLLPNNYIVNGVIGNGTKMNYSQMEDAKTGENCLIGPFARLRPKAEIKNNVHIGDFVELKNCVIDDGTKANHLAYVGDCDIGKNCNIGCGVIFVNYNGKQKQRTTVGDNSFIGSNSNIIAPVVIAKNTYICAGTTITAPVNEDDFVIGRVKQVNKENRAHKYLKEFVK